MVPLPAYALEDEREAQLLINEEIKNLHQALLSPFSLAFMSLRKPAKVL